MLQCNFMLFTLLLYYVSEETWITALQLYSSTQVWFQLTCMSVLAHNRYCEISYSCEVSFSQAQVSIWLLWPWPLTHELQSLISSSLISSECLWQFGKKFLYIKNYLQCENAAMLFKLFDVHDNILKWTHKYFYFWYLKYFICDFFILPCSFMDKGVWLIYLFSYCLFGRDT